MAESRFGPYVVYECLGAGGMATVHRASIELEDDGTREVALKRLLPQFADDKRFVEDLIREGKLAAQLEHPNIVRILELGRVGRTYFIAMDLVRGQPLMTLMTLMRNAYAKRMRPSIPVVLALMTEILDALDHAHSAHIVHRDLTPSNLVVTDDGHLKIIDFGVAKALAGTLQTSSGLAKGKLGYMSLEAVSGKQVDTRTDIFSAGVVMWELIAMKRMFKGTSDLELINAIREGVVEIPSQFNADCPTDLDGIVLKATAKEREGRWSSAAEMAEAIQDVRRYYPAGAREVAAWLKQLRAGAEHASPRVELDPESTQALESSHELFEDLDPVHLAEGSDAATYENLDDATSPPSPAKFKEADTVVSVSAFPDRKR